MPGDAAEQEPAARAVEPLRRLFDRERVVCEPARRRGNAPAPRQPEDEPRPRLRRDGAGAESHVDLREEVEGARRDPVALGVAVEVRAGRPAVIDGHRVGA